MNIRNCGVLKSSEKYSSIFNFVVIQERMSCIKYLPQAIVLVFFLSRRFHSSHLKLLYSVCTFAFNEILPSQLGYCYELSTLNKVALALLFESRDYIIVLVVLADKFQF